MRKNVIAQAGDQVQKQYDAMVATKNHTGAASNGTLPCKKIIFLPWQSGASNPHTLKPSLSTFVTSAIDYAVKNQYKSIGLFLLVLILYIRFVLFCRQFDSCLYDLL